MIPGEYQLAEGDILANVGRKTVTIEVTNSGDRPIQVGSHYHFFETNNALKFDRTLARGMRLNVPSGNAVRFEPGEVKSVELVAFGGSQPFTASIIKLMANYKVGQDGINNFKSAICSNLWPNPWR